MKMLRYIGTHQPKGMLIEAEEKDVERLLDSEEYEDLNSNKEIIISKEVSNDNSKRIKSRL